MQKNKLRKNNSIDYIKYGLCAIPILLGLITSFYVFRFGGLELSIRMVIIGIVLLLGAIISILGIKATYSNMKKTFISFLVVALIFSVGNIAIIPLLNKVYGTLENVSTKEETFLTAFVVSKESTLTNLADLTGKKIGYLDMESSMEAYILPVQELEDAGLKGKVTLLPYEEYGVLMSSLLAGEVDAIMIGGNYVSSYENMTGFENVASITKVIHEAETTVKSEVSSGGSAQELEKPFTILFMGVDTNKPSESGALTGNADALFVVTVNPINFTVNITSIPRDAYVPIACYSDQRRDKITHSNAGGTDCVMKTVGNVFDIEIDYYVKANFKGIEDLVDALGGVYINIDEETYPKGLVAQNGKRHYEPGYKWIYLRPGNYERNGEQALAYARTRKNLNGGATERASNQNEVINAIINKLTRISGVSKIYDILNAVGNNVQTNLTVDQMVSFYKLALNILDRANENNMNTALVIDYHLLSGYDRMIYHDQMEMLLYFYVPYKGSIEDITTAIKQNLGLIPFKTPTKFSYHSDYKFVKENSLFWEYNENKETFVLPDLVPDMYGWTETQARSWAESRGLKLTINEIKEGNPLFDANLENGFVIKHDQKINRKVSKISSINIDVIRKVVILPVIELLGKEDITLNLNDTFTDPGYKANDGKDTPTDITQNVTVTIHKGSAEGEVISKIDTSKTGTYIIVYSITHNQQTVTKSRIVRVVDKSTMITWGNSCGVNDTVNNGEAWVNNCSAKDGNSNNLTVTAEGNVNTAVDGKYTLKFYVTVNGNKIYFDGSKVVTVVTNQPTPSPDPSPSPSVDPSPTPSVEPSPSPSADPSPAPTN